MSKHPKPSSIFGALGPDDNYFDSRAQTAAREAQQRWPLLTAVTPQAQDATLPLTESDRAMWAPRAPTSAPMAKPKLGRPEMGGRLARGLERITHQVEGEVQSAAHRAALGATPPRAEEEEGGHAPSHTPNEPRTPMFAARAVDHGSAPAPLGQPTPAARRHAPMLQEPPSSVVGMPAPARPETGGLPAAHARAVSAPLAGAGQSGDLKGLFGRLAGASEVEQPSRTPAQRKSVMSRLAKR